jgi:Sigma-70, region 4
VSRLLRMIPAREDIPEEEQLGWITARLADPCFDWRTALAHPRPDKRGSGAPATPPASDVGEVLDIWQRINGSELGGERQARFLTSPALGDLVQFPVGVPWERGRRLFQAHGRLLLNDWAAECAVPGLTDVPDAGDLRKVLARTGESVRRLVAAAVAAVPDEGDREVLERRLGLSGCGPQTLVQIGAHLGISRERVRQRADRAVKAIASARARTGVGAENPVTLPDLDVRIIAAHAGGCGVPKVCLACDLRR